MLLHSMKADFQMKIMFRGPSFSESSKHTFTSLLITMHTPSNVYMLRGSLAEAVSLKLEIQIHLGVSNLPGDKPPVVHPPCMLSYTGQRCENTFVNPSTGELRMCIQV